MKPRLPLVVGLRLCHTTFRTAAIVVFAVVLPVVGSAQDTGHTLTPEAASSLGRFGVTIFKGSYDLISADRRSAKEIPSPDAATQQMNSLASDYLTNVRTGTFAADALQATFDVAITFGQLGASTTGVGAVPAALIASGARWANDQASGALRDAMRQEALDTVGRGLRNVDSKKIAEIKGALAEDDYAKAAALYDKYTGDLAQFKKRVAGDAAASEVGTAYLLNTIRENGVDALKAAGKNSVAIASLDKRFTDHVTFTAKFTTEATKRLTALEGNVMSLNVAVGAVQKDLANVQRTGNATAAQVGIIQEILFEQQSPDNKIRLLEINARPELSKEQRDSLIAFYKVEVRKTEMIQGSANVVAAAKDVAMILANLGVNDPRIGQVVRYASVAQTTLSQALTGNYLGAISSLSGLFGGGQGDPQLAAMSKRLEAMDKKLDAILVLQQKTLEAIGKLSEQVADMEQRLQERLDRMEFRDRTIEEGVLVLLWEKFQTCYAAYAERNDTGDRRPGTPFDEDQLRYVDTPALVGFVKNHSGAVFPCAVALRNSFLTFQSQGVFGNPLSLRFASTSNLPVPSDTAKYFKQEDLANFLTMVYEPAWDVVRASWPREWGSPGNVLASLSTPAPNTVVLKSRVAELNKAEGKLLACGTPTLLARRTQALLCANEIEFSAERHGGAGSEDIATQRLGGLMREAIVRDQLADLMRWTALAARGFDFAPGENPNSPPLSLDDLATKGSSPHGPTLLTGALWVLDVAIAQQTMLNGDLTAYFAYQVAWDEKAGGFRGPADPAKPTPLETRVRTLLEKEQNPWLRRNVLMLGLDSALRLSPDQYPYAWRAYASALEPFASITTKEALSEAEIATNNRLASRGKTYLLALFKLPDDVVFSIEDVPDPNDKNAPPNRIVYFSHNGMTKIALPTPQEFRDRELKYPVSLRVLLRNRELLAAHLADYQTLANLPENERISAARVLLDRRR